jgi:hypothetical protein
MAGVLKVKQLDGSWVDITGAGPPGPTGATGATGAAGATGDDGAPGIIIDDTAPANTDVLWADTTVGGDGTSGITSVGPIDIVSIWAGTQDDYDAVVSPDANTLYVVVEEV